MPGASGGVTADTVAPGKSQAPHESRQDNPDLRSEDDREARDKNEPSPPQSPQNPCKLPTEDPTVLPPRCERATCFKVTEDKFAVLNHSRWMIVRGFPATFSRRYGTVGVQGLIRVLGERME